MLVIPDWVDSEQWLYANMPSKNSQYYGKATRQRGRIIRVGLSGLGDVVVNPEVTSVLSQQSDYNKAVSVNAQLSQRISTLDQNIAQWKSAKVLEKDRTAALAVLNKQRNQAVADQSKLKSALASLMVAAAQDIKSQPSVDPAANAKYRNDLTTRLNNLTKARADAVAEVEPGAELNKALATIDGQINKIKSQIRAAGGSVSGLSGLGINYWYEDYPTDYPVYVNGLSGLDASWGRIRIGKPKIVSQAAAAVKTAVKQAATVIRNVTKKLPAANFMSKVAARFPLTAPIVRLTGNKQQRRLAVQGMKALAVVAAIVVAVALAPLVLPSLAAAASAAGSAVAAGAGAVASAVGAAGAAIGAGAAAAGGAIAAGAATTAAFVGAHALATTAVITGGAALAMGKKKKKKAPGQTAPLPGETQDANYPDIVWVDPPVSDADPSITAPVNPATGKPDWNYIPPSGAQPDVPGAPYIAPGVEVQSDPVQSAPYIAPASPASSYSGGGSGGGPGPLDSGETTPQAYGDGSAVAVSATKLEAPKSNKVKYALAIGGLAAVGGLTYYFMTRK